MDGIFILNKAAGMTSHDVVARVRRLARQKRVGHAGTLDPAATGVLPVCLGQATRVAEYLSESGKAYRATIRFGTVTDTYDAEGGVVRTAPVAIAEEEIAAALPSFLGEQMQAPPVYSAIKRGGQPLYKLARAGKEVVVELRPIVIYALRIISWSPPDLTLDVECGKGTYIRSLAYDLGERMGPGAHLAALVRTRSGPFTLKQSITLEALEVALAGESWQDHLYAADEALLERRAAILGPENVARVRNGQLLRFDDSLRAMELPPPEDGELLRAYSTDGRFLGILRWEAEAAAWQPHKVLMGEPVADQAPPEA
ncbi:MAG TPA: tRNA pseudouridine(55) synthase TruB [Ktedonobacterales bacterium]|nr:tRNA pseudouridine(55) synthase TruB [Ktedonobacterales bacterium]